MIKDFVHLHNHSHYSILDGASHIDRMVKYIKEHGMGAIALTDHGNMSGSVKLWDECRKENVKPIVGCEIYVSVSDDHKDKGVLKQDRSINSPRYYHLVLLALNKAGYKNLCKIVSTAFTEGFYFKPRISKRFLAEHSEGLFATSACMANDIARVLRFARNDEQAVADAKKLVNSYTDIFGDNFRLELQDHGIPEQYLINLRMIKLSEATGVPLIWTNDCHFVTKEDYGPHKALVCIGRQSKNKAVTYDSLDHVYKEDHRIKTIDELNAIINKYPVHLRDTIAKSMADTVEIAGRADFNFQTNKYYFPNINITERVNSYFRKKVFDGFQKIAPDLDQSRITEYINRLNSELWLIESMGFESYFLLVADVIQYARDSETCSVGPGRGSVGGSLVAYALGITEVDPIKHGLLFERFLNPERISMPDIDMDFNARGRQEVIDYVVAKYGRDNVAQIITFGTLKPRNAVRSVGRIFGMPPTDYDRLAKLIPQTPNDPWDMEKALKEIPELAEIVNSKDPSDATKQKVLEYSESLEETIRNPGIHAAGIVITPKPVSEYLPLWYIPGKETVVAGYDMKDIEKIGLVKMDFLGLTTLDVITDCIELIKKEHGIDVTKDVLAQDFDDENIYNEIFSRGKTAGIFQFESRGMRNSLIALKPTCLDHIVAMNALYRPGPIGSGMMAQFISRKNGEVGEGVHPKLEHILKSTHGVVVYQEQVMSALQELAGYTLGQADMVRKAIGKKDQDLLEKELDKFVAAAVAKGNDEEEMRKIAEDFEGWGRYGFNRSHSVAYAILAYRTAWLKFYYPIEFMAALLSSEISDPDKIRAYIEEAKEMGLLLLPPDVNYAVSNFSIEPNGEIRSIRFGLAAVKNLGVTLVDAITVERTRGGLFRSFMDMLERIPDLAADQIEALIFSGATESLGGTRAQHFASYPPMLEARKKRRTKKLPLGQMSVLSSLPATERLAVLDYDMVDAPPWTDAQISERERQALGFWLTAHPMRDVKTPEGFVDVAEVKEWVESHEKRWGYINFIGILTEVNKKITSGHAYYQARVEDRTGGLEFILGNQFNPEELAGKLVHLRGYIKDARFKTTELKEFNDGKELE